MKDSTLIYQLKNDEKSSYELLYKIYYPSILSFIKNNNGNEQDAEDIFQEVIVILLKKIKTDNFVLTSSLKTYLYSIARNIWLNRLRDNKLVLMDILPSIIEDEQIQDIETNQEKLLNWLEKITINCQNILKSIFFYKEPIENLMIKMGWKNRHTAANQQYKCIQQIKKQQNKEVN